MTSLKSTAASLEVPGEVCMDDVDYDFVEKPSKEFYCPVTFDLLREPHQTLCCGNHLSHEAVTKLQQSRDPCPLCNKFAFKTLPDKFFKRKVNDLLVRCLNKGKGCGWVGELGSLDQHLNKSLPFEGDCQFVTVDCPHSCGAYFQRSQFVELQEHETSSCPNRPFACEFCGHKATYNEITGEHCRICEKYPVECPNREQGCQWSGTQGDIGRHLNYDSFEGEFEECQFVSVACPHDCNYELQRREIDSHKADDCPNRPFTCRYCSHKATYNEVINEHWASECEKYPLPCPRKCGEEGIKRQDLEKHFRVCPMQVIDCEFSHVGCEVGCQRQHMRRHMDEDVTPHLSLVSKVVEEQQQTIREHQKTFEAVFKEHQNAARRQATEMGARIGEQGMEIEELNAKIGELNDKIEEHCSEMKQRDAEWCSRVAEQDARINEQGSFIAEQQCTIKQQQNEIEALILVLSQALPKPIKPVFIPPPDFVMANFEEHKTSEELWSSCPFYSHIGGYKMCLRVHANGSGTARGTHVSVAVELMEGEHDDHLKWPFCRDITWQLLNQRRKMGHLQKTVNFCDTVGPRGVASSPGRLEIARLVRGYSKFISHAELVTGSQDKEYLKNNCLKFRISKVVVNSVHSEEEEHDLSSDGTRIERNAPLKASDGDDTQIAPLKASDGDDTQIAPLTASDGDDTQIAPLKASDGDDTQIAPLKASDGDDTQIAPLDASDGDDVWIKQNAPLDASDCDDVWIKQNAPLDASDCDDVRIKQNAPLDASDGDDDQI